MLMGEHAVLQGSPAFVAAINRYMHLQLLPRQDRIIRIVSKLGELETSLDKLEVMSPFQFVLTTILQYKSRLQSGFELMIESDFSDKMGFGSSAAVVVGTINVLDQLLEEKLKKFEIFEKARSIIRQVQGQGSGADVAASVFGGVIYYQPSHVNNNNIIEVDVQVNANVNANVNVNDFPNIYAIYSGSKVPTPTVISLVQKNREKNPSLYENIFNTIAVCTKEARAALLKKDWTHFGQLMNIHHGLQSALGLSNTVLESLVYKLRNIPGIIGAKISGAGLGDCVIGIGEINGISGTNMANETYNDIISLKLGQAC